MWGPSLAQGVWAYRDLPGKGRQECMAKDQSAEPHTPQMLMLGDTVKRSSEGAEPFGPLFLRMGALKGRWEGQAGAVGTYQLMALGLALQLLVVVKGEAVQHSMLLLVHCGHGALLVDLVNVDLLLAL